LVATRKRAAAGAAETAVHKIIEHQIKSFPFLVT